MLMVHTHSRDLLPAPTPSHPPHPTTPSPGSPDLLPWVEEVRNNIEERSVNVRALSAELSSGTSRAVANPGQAIFDNLQLVTRRVPELRFESARESVAGTPLGARELNALSSVPGTFTYTPAAGAMLTAGKQLLTVTFTPSDTNLFSPVSRGVVIRVREAKGLRARGRGVR